MPVGPNPGKHSGSLRELGANEPTDGPQKTRKTLESPASGMTQQHEKYLSEEWMGLGQSQRSPCAKHEAGAIACSQVHAEPQDGADAFRGPRYPTQVSPLSYHRW